MPEQTVLLIFLACVILVASETWDKNVWYGYNDAELAKALKKPNTNVAKNLILAIGDGMGLSTATAIRVYKGQKDPNMIGEEAMLSFDHFPHTGLSKTYSTDMMTVDSAASATAYHCGVKTKYEVVGLDDKVVRGDCNSVEGSKVDSVLDEALKEGKSVGIITTDALVGASPSGAYAHSPLRNWRYDGEMPAEARVKCKDIARQLVEDNLDIQVLLGGGMSYFTPNTVANGYRTDGKNLTGYWLSAQQNMSRKASFVTDFNGFDQVTAANTDYLLGIFANDRMQEETERKLTNTQPSIAQMTEKAIKILSKNPKGFYLFIEGANIDMGHHTSRARYALEEGLAFDDAVAVAEDLTSSDDTLVVVSADHSHAFSFGGYAQRGQSILSIANNSYYNYTTLEGNYYPILSYGNGPGNYNETERAKFSDEYYSVDRVYPSPSNLGYESHGGEDVPIFASGPMSHLFTGVHEQTFIAHGMAYAACIGRDKSHCVDKKPPNHGLMGAQVSSVTLLVTVCISLIAGLH